MDSPDDDCTFFDAEDAPDAMGNTQAADAESPVVIDPRRDEGVSLPDTFGESSTDDVGRAGTSPPREAVSLPDDFGETSTDDPEDAALDGGAKRVESDVCEKVVVGEALLSPPATIRFADDSASSCGSVKEARDEVDDTAPVLVSSSVEPLNNELASPLKDEFSKVGLPTDVVSITHPPNEKLPDEPVLPKLEPIEDSLENLDALKDELSLVEALKDERLNAEASKVAAATREHHVTVPAEALTQVEPPKDELPPKVEAASDELPKVEAASDELPNVEAASAELPNIDVSTDKLPKIEPASAETPTDELPNVKLPKVEASKEEQPKAEPPKGQLPKDTHWEEDEEDEGYLAGVLGKTSDKAEARLAARRQARAEAREIRMRELERQQKEIEESCNKNYDSFTDTGGRTPRSAASIATRSTSLGGSNSYLSSRRSSEDSLEEGISLRDVRHELKEVEEKFRKAMIQNAQLDNEKASLTYQVELLKDRLEDLEEAHAQLQREHRDKGRELDQLKRTTAKLKEDMEWFKGQMEERDRLIQEKGLMIVGDDQASSDEGSDEPDSNSPKKPCKRALVTIESAELLQSTGEGSLDVRLRRFAEERNELQDQVRHLKLELEEQYSRNKSEARRVSGATMNGPDTEVEDVQREANKLLGEYKFKLQKAEQDVSTLQATVARLESQVIRYKTSSESAEKVEDELKVEKRKLQRELRESQSRVEELEVSNSHLQRRLEKLKNAKSALLKEL